MSCHDIGRGMNSVVRTTITLLDKDEISIEAAKEILWSCAKGVNWCDGNRYEAVDYIQGCRCGRCLKKLPKGEKLYSVDSVSIPFTNGNKLWNYTITGRLCPNCFDDVLNGYCKDENTGERERHYIEDNCDEEYYLSAGEYGSTNNGCQWPE